MHRHFPVRPHALLSAFLLIAATAVGAAGTADSLEGAFAQGSASLSFRYRYETVDQDGLDRDATASTLRTRLTLETAEYEDFSGLLEFSNVSALGGQRYNSTRNGRTQYPVVADPTGSEINQAWLRYSGMRNGAFTLGRQRIYINNQRYVSGAPWRQNEQTYDSAWLGLGAREQPLQFDYYYVWRVQRVFGPEQGVPDDEFDSDTHLLNARYTHSPLASLTAYAFFMEFDDAQAVSNRTFGLRFTGKYELGDERSLSYTAELARQADHGDNPADYDANYYHAELSAAAGHYSGTIGTEVLEGDAANPGRQFITPLATAHKFHGWADKFGTVLPDAGIEDRYVALHGRFPHAVQGTLKYHVFDAQSGSADYGSEWDLLLTKTFAKKHALTLLLASYDADAFATDTTKLYFLYSSTFGLGQ